MRQIDADHPPMLMPKEEALLQRRQVLVLETNRVLSPEDGDAFRQEVLKQLESGLVILPPWVKAITIDADAVVVLS